MIGLDIVYCVTAGKACYYVYQHTCNGFETHTCTSFGLSAWIVLFAIIQMILSMVRFCPPVTQFCCCGTSWTLLIITCQKTSKGSGGLMSSELQRCFNATLPSSAVCLNSVYALLHGTGKQLT